MEDIGRNAYDLLRGIAGVLLIKRQVAVVERELLEAVAVIVRRVGALHFRIVQVHLVVLHSFHNIAALLRLLPGN